MNPLKVYVKFAFSEGFLSTFRVLPGREHQFFRVLKITLKAENYVFFSSVKY